MENPPNPESKELRSSRRISSATIIVTGVAFSLLALCALAAPNFQHESAPADGNYLRREPAPVVDGNYLRREEAPVADGSGSARDENSQVTPAKTAAAFKVAVAVKPIKAHAKIIKSDYRLEKPKKLNVNINVEGNAWHAPDTDRLVGSVAKRDIPGGKIITSKDADLN
jgi:hypothetical protein